MNKFKEKRLIIKYTLILLIITLKNNQLKKKNIIFFHNNFFLHTLLLINYREPSQIDNKKIENYLHDKNFFLYKICFYYLTLKNLMENPKILIKKKLYTYAFLKKKNKKIKKWFWQFKFLKKFKLKFLRLKILKKLYFVNYLNRYFSTLMFCNPLMFYFSLKKKINIHVRKKKLKTTRLHIIRIKKKNKKISKNFWLKLKKKTLFLKKNFNNEIKIQNFNKFLLTQNIWGNNINFSHIINFFNLHKWIFMNNRYTLTNLKNIFTLPYNTRILLYDLIQKKTVKQQSFLLFCRLFIINFYECFLKTKIFLKFYKNVTSNWSLNVMLVFLTKKFKNIQNFIGKGFFLKEMFYIIFYMFKYKDILIFKNWLVTNLERMTFIKHRKFFYFLKLILKSIFTKITKLFNIRGFYLDVTGKISVSGDAQTRRYIITKGFTSFSSYTYKLNYTKFTVRTSTGLLGLTLAISYL